MVKQSPPKSKRGRPPGSTNKVPAKRSNGNIDKFVTSKMERSISSVKIKKEKMEEISQRKAKVIVSPDKAKTRRAKTDKRSLSPSPKHKESIPLDIEMENKDVIDLVHENHKMEDMDIDEQSQLTQVNEENVSTFVKSTKLGLLLALPINQMRQVVQAWKIRQQDTNSDAVKTMTADVLMLDIEEAKEEVETEMRREFLRERIESEVREDLAQIKFMNLSKSSSLAEIQLFNKEELCIFVRHMNNDKTKKKPINMIRDMSYEDLQEWTLEILKDIPNTDPLPPIDETEAALKPKSNIGIVCDNIEKETPKEEKVSDHSKDLNTLSNNEFILEVNKSKETVLKRDVTSGKQEDQSIKIKDTLKNRDIMNATIESLKSAYHQFTIETGVPIQSDVIDSWPKSVLQEIIKAKRDILVSKNPPVKKNNSIMKQKSKYSGKKLLQTNLTQGGKTMNTCRYSLAFTIPDEYKGTEGLRKYLMDVFSEMVNYGDDGFCLLPWETDAITDKIDEPDDIPERITDIKKYFNGARSPESSVYIYTKLRLGFPVTSDKTNFDADIQGWCKNRSIRFYVCSVQHPNVRSCGWLAYMPRTVNQEKWCQVVKQLYESMYKNSIQPEFQIGLTWRVLNGQKDVDKKSKLRAMHIDAPVEIGTKVKRFLRALSSKKKWILGVKYRVIDEI